MNTEKMREEFEKIFPPSPEFYWDEDKGRYVGDKHYGPGFSHPTNENSARLQMLRLEGFMAARTGGEVLEIGNLILPAVEDGEYPDCDIEWDSDAAEKLQEKLVSNEDVNLPIYVGGIPAPAAKAPEGGQ